MSRRYYLGLNAGGPGGFKCLFTHGRKKDLNILTWILGERYQGRAILTKNGRSALTLALKSYFDKGDKIIVNGFTCFAVYEAVLKAGMKPVFADINEKDLNFDTKTLKKALEKGVKGVIVQNSLGNPVDIKSIENFCKKNKLVIIEDLAHLVGGEYPDGREIGTVGAATAFSFGKDKAINTISGGALVLRAPVKHEIKAPFKIPRFSDYLRARFYGVFCGMCRGLNKIHLGGPLMRCFIKIHWVEKSADSKLDITRRLAKFQARMAIKQFEQPKSNKREFCLVKDQKEVLNKLKKSKYFFDSFWYEKPVSPERYYQKVHFPEDQCPVAVKVCGEIINLPTYYDEASLAPAKKIIKPYLVGGKNG